MSRRALVGWLLLLFIGAAAARLAAQAPANPPRLIADNRTRYAADIYAWNGSSWNFVRRVNPQTWLAFPNAANLSVWRAVIGQTVREHQVRYVWNPTYNGYQDVWVIN